MLSPVAHTHDTKAFALPCKWCGQKTTVAYTSPNYGFHLTPKYLPFCNLDCYRSYHS